MGCAGGIDFISTLPLSREAIPAGFETFKLTLKGLKGGHSGGDIHLARATPTNCWRVSWRAMPLNWICVWWTSTAVLCVTRSSRSLRYLGSACVESGRTEKLSSVYLEILKTNCLQREKPDGGAGVRYDG